MRGTDGEVRAFHNICRHRGNKLVWNDFPQEETSGTCRQFTCKYHGWRYGLEGDLTFVQQESEFFDLDKADYGLVAVQARGVGGVHLRATSTPTTPSRSATYLGELGAGLEGYPFGEMTQVYKYRADVGSNWKLFIDAFAEFYHAPVLHAKQAVAEESRKLQGYGFEALAYELDGPHGMVSSWGGMSPPKDPSMVKPIERVLRSGLFGPWDKPDIDLDELPAGAQPGPPPGVGRRHVRVLPELHAARVGAELVPHVPLLADGLQPAHLRGHALLRARRRTPRERLQQELAAVTFKEYALQDGNTLEATQRMHRVAGRHELPAERPGDPAAPAAQDRPRPRRRPPGRPAETPVRISAAS